MFWLQSDCKNSPEYSRYLSSLEIYRNDYEILTSFSKKKSTKIAGNKICLFMNTTHFFALLYFPLRWARRSFTVLFTYTFKSCVFVCMHSFLWWQSERETKQKTELTSYMKLYLSWCKRSNSTFVCVALHVRLNFSWFLASLLFSIQFLISIGSRTLSVSS